MKHADITSGNLSNRRSVLILLFISAVLLIAGRQWQLENVLHHDTRQHDQSVLTLRTSWRFWGTHLHAGSRLLTHHPGTDTNRYAATTGNPGRSSAIGNTTASTSTNNKQAEVAAGSQQQPPSSIGQGVVQPHSHPHPKPTLSSRSSSRLQKGGVFLHHLPPSRDAVSRHAVQLRLPTNPTASTPSTTSTTNVSSTSKGVLQKVLRASARTASDPVYRKKLEAAASTPINVAVMTGLLWDPNPAATQGCKVDGIPLDCNVRSGGTEEYIKQADALYYHVPSFGGKPRPKAFPNQLRLAMSLESAAYYPNLDNPEYMCQFDAEMSYRTCAQVINWYSLEALDKLFKVPLIPFEEKVHAIAYINSNCNTESPRAKVMRQLVGMGDNAKVPVHALGGCDHNTAWPEGNPSKVEVMRKYKFCVAMENSNRGDYLTEKLWDALAAGCIPIYLGSQSAPHVIPDPNSMILYDPSGKSGHASTPEQLEALMHQIGSDKQRYEAMTAWKRKKPEEQPSEAFRYLWNERQTTGECFLCRFLARHRAEPQPHYTTCLFNKDWMEMAGQHYVPEENFCGKAPITQE